MRYFWAPLVLLIMATGPVLGQKKGPPVGDPEPVVVRAELIQLSDEGAARLESQSRVPSGFWDRPERGRVLQSLELMLVTQQDGLLVFGHKSPIIYYDARATQFQVQYVDTGVKLDVKVEAEGEGTYKLEARAEFSRIERMRTFGAAPAQATYPQVQVIIPNTSLSQVRPGESYIVSRTDETAARGWLQSQGLSGGADRLVVVVTLLQPR